MFEKIRSWNKLVRYIVRVRKQGISKFKILTTDSELIFIAEDKKNKKRKFGLRIKY